MESKKIPCSECKYSSYDTVEDSLDPAASVEAYVCRITDKIVDHRGEVCGRFRV